MASPQKLEAEIELKCNAEKSWEGIKNLATVLPKVSPDKYESIEVLEGDGISAGSILVFNHPPGHPITWTKKKIELVDEEKKTLCCTIIGGDLMKYYKNFKEYFALTPKGEGTLAKWSCEAERASEDAPALGIKKDLFVETAKELEAYLLKA